MDCRELLRNYVFIGGDRQAIIEADCCPNDQILPEISDEIERRHKNLDEMFENGELGKSEYTGSKVYLNTCADRLEELREWCK